MIDELHPDPFSGYVSIDIAVDFRELFLNTLTWTMMIVGQQTADQVDIGDLIRHPPDSLLVTQVVAKWNSGVLLIPAGPENTKAIPLGQKVNISRRPQKHS